MHIKKHHIYYAPWHDRLIRTHFLRGTFAWEIQIGNVVFQLLYRHRTQPYHSANLWQRLVVWRDTSRFRYRWNKESRVVTVGIWALFFILLARGWHV